jgi:hypothetical protein
LRIDDQPNSFARLNASQPKQESCNLKSMPKPKTAKRSKAASTQKPTGTSISHSQTLAELAEFWDTHDTTEYPAEWVEFEISPTARRRYAAIDPDDPSDLNGITVSLAKGL